MNIPEKAEIIEDTPIVCEFKVVSPQNYLDWTLKENRFWDRIIAYSSIHFQNPYYMALIKLRELNLQFG